MILFKVNRICIPAYPDFHPFLGQKPDPYKSLQGPIQTITSCLFIPYNIRWAPIIYVHSLLWVLILYQVFTPAGLCLEHSLTESHSPPSVHSSEPWISFTSARMCSLIQPVLIKFSKNFLVPNIYINLQLWTHWCDYMTTFSEALPPKGRDMSPSVQSCKTRTWCRIAQSTEWRDESTNQ